MRLRTCLMNSVIMCFLQKCGTAGSRILYLLKQGGKRAYLLYNNNSRYAQYAIPVTEGTAIYMYVLEIKKSPNCIKLNATECFPGNILASAQHPKNCLRNNRGILCNSGYVTEYNILRMFVANNENVGDSKMKAIANTYGPIFMQCMFPLVFLPPILH